MWQETFDVYVSDKHKLGLQEYFSKQNPHARQMLAARLLEVDRQGVYRFSDADRKALVKAYVESVNRDGVSCYANACDNKKLVSYVTAQAGEAVPAAAAAQWQDRMNEALTTPRDVLQAQAAANQPSLTRRRAATLQETFPNMRIFEVSEGKLRVAGREVGWGWLLVVLASLVAGACLSLAQRRMDGSVISLMAGRGGNG